MTFEILNPTDAKLTSVTPRTEKHGDEDGAWPLPVGPQAILDPEPAGTPEKIYWRDAASGGVLETVTHWAEPIGPNVGVEPSERSARTTG